MTNHAWSHAARAAMRCVVCILAASTMTGCARFSTEKGVANTWRAIEAPVLEALGPPAKLSALGEGMVFLYEEAELLERQLGINIHFRDVPILKFVVGRGSAERQAMALVFDDTGLLRGARRDSWNQDLGGGASAQLVGAVVPVTDSGGLDESPAVHDWGAMLLQPNLPIALNPQSSLLTGQNGVQQFGTPLTAGQHSLELRTSSRRR